MNKPHDLVAEPPLVQEQKPSLTETDLANCVALGLHVMEDHPEPQECRRAYKIFRRAAEAGYQPAALALGELCRLRNEKPWQSIGWWSKGLDADRLTSSQVELGNLLAGSAHREEVNRQLPATELQILLRRVAAYYRRSYLFPSQCREHRLLTLFGFRAAMTCNSVLDEMGDLNGSYHLGLLHLQGKGMSPNAKRGVALLEKAANAGHLGAIIVLAACYGCGLFGVTGNHQRAVELMSVGATKLLEPKIAHAATRSDLDLGQASVDTPA